MTQKYLVNIGEEEVTLELRREGSKTYVRREEGEWQKVQLERVGETGLYLLLIDSQPLELYLERRRGGAVVEIGRHTFNAEVSPWRPGGRQRARALAASGVVRITSPMTGSIVDVRCKPGDEVAAGDVLLVIESMKMNNEIRTPTGGVVEVVPVSPAQRVNANDLLVSIKSG